MAHHTKDKGDLGVAHAELDLIEKGFGILLLRTEHAPFDLVAFKDDWFLRVQVKYRAATNGFIHVPFSTSWADRNGTHTRLVDKDHVDLYSVFCPDTRRCYYLDPQRFNRTVQLRLTPPRNGVLKGVHFAENFLEIPEGVRGVKPGFH